MDGSFKLSASLEGHDDDVRGVAFPDASLVLSASRDASVRLWRLIESAPPRFDSSVSSHGSSFINVVAFVPSSAENPEGLIISGGRDAIIEVRRLGKSPSENADGLLLGHSGNICALDVSEDGTTIVSGSWDAEARIWLVGKWEASAVLKGHQGSVWAVLAYAKDIFITGSADKLIRVFNSSGKLIRSISGSEDVVRALCRLPASSSSGAQFASAGNDAIVRLWTLNGVQVAQLHGHENFIYSLAALPNGELASAGEDRTVRIWKGNQCIQTITHPAISVWSVAACASSGDIVTGSSDKIVRVFSRSKDRHADAAVISAFEESVKASAIPQQSLGEINKTDLPGPDFLQQKSGTKEGQVQMIKESNGNVSAYQWSSAAQQWVNVGTVVEAAGTTSKISYNGKDYDYVFDVDIEEGQPPLKLPYNASQNPYEVARKFIEDNELPISYLDQVTNFIVTNSQGTSIGQSSRSAPGADPWGTESRYRPGDGQQAPSSFAPQVEQKTLPQKEYLAISTANHKMILKKIDEFNHQLIADGRKDLSLNPSGFDILSQTTVQIEPAAGKKEATIQVSPDAVDSVLRAATMWPIEKRLPGLDLLRLLTAASETTITHTNSDGKSLIDVLEASDSFSPSQPPNNTMLAIRTLVNLFSSKPGRDLAEQSLDQILNLVSQYTTSSSKNLIIALTTLYINYSVLLTSSDSYDADSGESGAAADGAITLLDALTSVLNHTEEPEALYRALVATGTVLYLGKDFSDVAREGLGIEDAIKRAETVGKEVRIQSVVREIRSSMA